MTTFKTITPREWNTATREQRREWLRCKVVVKSTEVERLREQVRTYREKMEKERT